MSFLLNTKKIEDVNVIYFEVLDLPSPDEIKQISHDIKTIVTSTEINYALYAIHTCNSRIEFPSFEHFQVILEVLKESKVIIASQLLGTVIQVKKLDDASNLAKELFLLIYNPIKPFIITQNAEESIQFLKHLVNV